MYTFSLVEFLFESRIQINIKWMPFVFRLNICIIYSRRFTSSHVAVLQCNEMHWFTYQLNLGTILVLLLLFFFSISNKVEINFLFTFSLKKPGKKWNVAKNRRKTKLADQMKISPSSFTYWISKRNVLVSLLLLYLFVVFSCLISLEFIHLPLATYQFSIFDLENVRFLSNFCWFYLLSFLSVI